MPLRNLSAGEARHFAGERPGRQRTVTRELVLSRRGFVAATLGFGGSVLFYMRLGNQPASAASPTAAHLNGWIPIAPPGAVPLFSRPTDLDTGALTPLALVFPGELGLEPPPRS